MSAQSYAPHLAVLIDADNVPAKHADWLLNEIGGLGHLVIGRVYGDIASARGEAWQDAAERHALGIRHQRSRLSGKNSADIALVLEAMDILASGAVDGFCIVSSDSDFTGLAIRIREAGMPVYGFGKAKTLECFQRACSKFLVLDRAAEETLPQTEFVTSDLVQATDLIWKALSASTATDGLVMLSHVGAFMRQRAPDFCEKHLGKGKLKKLVLETQQFDVITLKKGQDGVAPRQKVALKLVKP